MSVRWNYSDIESCTTRRAKRADLSLDCGRRHLEVVTGVRIEETARKRCMRRNGPNATLYPGYSLWLSGSLAGSPRVYFFAFNNRPRHVQIFADFHLGL